MDKNAEPEVRRRKLFGARELDNLRHASLCPIIGSGHIKDKLCPERYRLSPARNRYDL